MGFKDYYGSDDPVDDLNNSDIVQLLSSNARNPAAHSPSPDTRNTLTLHQGVSNNATQMVSRNDWNSETSSC